MLAISFPLFVVPLHHASRFLLICESNAFICSNLLSGDPDFTSTGPLSEVPPRYPAVNRHLPLWTQWTRPLRNFENDTETLYLVREDGIISYIQVDSHAVRCTEAGTFGCLVDSAFANISTELNMPDMLVVAGDSSDGEVIKIGSWKNKDINRTRLQVMEPLVIESLPNWSPLMDLAPRREGSLSRQPPHQQHQYEQHTLFATSNRAPYGAVSEFRWGLEARLAFNIDSDGFEHATAVWQLPGLDQHTLFLLFSFATQTTLLRLCLDRRGDITIDAEYDAQNGHLCFDAETIAAAALPGHCFVQVTHQAIYLLRLVNTHSTVLARLASAEPSAGGEGGAILTAAIEPTHGIIVTANRDHQGSFKLHVRRVLNKDNPDDHPERPQITSPDSSFSVPSEPTCLAIRILDGRPLIATGTATGSLHLLTITPQGQFHELWGHHGTDQMVDSSPSLVCGSVALLAASSPSFSTAASEYLAVFAMRDGALWTMTFTFNDANDYIPSFVCLASESIRIGYTPPRLFVDGLGPSVAYVTCGTEICHLTFRGSRSIQSLLINSVWFTDHDQPSLRQGAVDALCCIPVLEYPDMIDDTAAITPAEGAFAGYTVGVSGTKLLGAQVDQQANVVPRKLAVRGNPHRLIHSQGLGRMVVASVETTERRPPQLVEDPNAMCPTIRQSGTRTITSLLQCVPYEETFEVDEEGTPEEPIVRSMLPGFKAHALIEWTYTDEKGNFYPFVIIGGGCLDPENSTQGQEQTGKLLIYQTRPDRNGRPHIKSPKSIDFDKPIYAVEVYGPTQLVICHGKSVSMWELCDHRYFFFFFFFFSS